MSVLTILSVAYAVVLVLALAVGLVSILYYLHRARKDLAQIAEGLRQVDGNVEPLAAALTTVNHALEDLSGQLRKADENLAPLRPEVAGERRTV